MKHHIIIFVLSLVFISLVSCVGRCGPDNYVPTGPQDCIHYSNSTTACCYLEMRDAPADYSMCFYLDLKDVTPIISIGRLSYRVDCDGISNFTQYFPLENLYRPCGVGEPLSPKDCWIYTTGYGACCMAGSSPKMNGEEDPFCYFFPEAKYDKKDFKVDTNIPGLQYYVSCKGSWFNVKNNFTLMSVLLLLILLL
jgi:hypothetical protein